MKFSLSVRHHVWHWNYTDDQDTAPSSRCPILQYKEFYVNNYDTEREMAKETQPEKTKGGRRVSCAGRWVISGPSLQRKVQ